MRELEVNNRKNIMVKLKCNVFSKRVILPKSEHLCFLHIDSLDVDRGVQRNLKGGGDKEGDEY